MPCRQPRRSTGLEDGSQRPTCKGQNWTSAAGDDQPAFPAENEAYGCWSAAPNWGPLVLCSKTAMVQRELFSDLVAQEQQWLERQQRPDELLANAGWQLRCEQWLEHLTLPGGTELADRWLSRGVALPASHGGDQG